VESQVLEGLARRVEKLNMGIELVRFGIRDVHAPPEVHAAFRDVASAHEDKQTAINIALRYLTETVNLARGEAAREVEVAKSFATSKVLQAEGESRSLTLRSNAYRENTVGTFARLYLETVEEVLAKARKIIRPGFGGTGNVDLWISSGGEAAPVTDVLRGSEVRSRTDDDRNRTKE
jgi:membrane protease subunit HflK